MSHEEISFDRHFIAVWRAKWLIIVVVILASTAAWWRADRQPPSAGATALVKVGRVWKEPLEDPFITEAAVNTPGFFQELAAKIGGNPSHLKRGVRSEVVIAGPRKTRYPILLSIATTAASADEAVRLAQAVSDEIITRHQKLFDEALAPYREREMLIETQLKEAAGSRELQSKLALELNEVKSNTSSRAMTERTRLLEPIIGEPGPRPGASRSIATAALLSALASIALALLVGQFKPTR